MDDALIGRWIGGYRMDRFLGGGGMAKVYLAWDAKLQRNVAVKLMLPFGDENFQARFQQEALATARLDHPNIVHIYDYGQDANMAYMAMEHLPGGSLHDRQMESARNRQRVDAEWALAVVQHIALALHHAHQSGIIHRDVKPSNIMFAKDGRPVLTDLGIAKALHGPKLTKAMTTIGTPEYMSPEQGRGDPIDPRSDLYSLGVVLYELLAGTLPYPADTPWGIVFKHMSEPLPSIEKFNPTISPALRSVVAKALAKRPEDRFQSGEEMADALRRAQAQPSQALYASPPPPQPIVLPPPPVSPDSETRIISTAPPVPDERVGVEPGAAAQPAPSHAKKRGLPLAPLAAGVAVVILAVAGLVGLPALRGGAGHGGSTSAPTSSATLLAALPGASDAGNRSEALPGATASETPTVAVVGETATPSPSPTLEPTETASPSPTATVLPTTTSEPTVTASPTSTATAAATASAAPTPRPPAPPTATPVPLVAPAPLAPPDNAEGRGQITLKWSAVPGAQGYRIQTRSDLEGQQAWRDWQVDGVATEYTFYFEGVPDYFRQPGTTYAWRVVAIGANGRVGTLSDEWHFRNQRNKPSTGDW